MSIQKYNNENKPNGVAFSIATRIETGLSNPNPNGPHFLAERDWLGENEKRELLIAHGEHVDYYDLVHGAFFAA